MRAVPLPCPSCRGTAFQWISPVMERSYAGQPVPRRLYIRRPGSAALAPCLDLFVCRGCGRAQWGAYVEDPTGGSIEPLRDVSLEAPVVEDARCLRCGPGPHLGGVAHEHDHLGGEASTDSAVAEVASVRYLVCRSCGAVRWFGHDLWKLDYYTEHGLLTIRPLARDEDLPCGCPRVEPGPLKLREVPDHSHAHRAAAALVQRRWHGLRWLGVFEATLCRQCGELFWYVPEPGALAGEPGVQMIEASGTPAAKGPYR